MGWVCVMWDEVCEGVKDCFSEVIGVVLKNNHRQIHKFVLDCLLAHFSGLHSFSHE